MQSVVEEECTGNGALAACLAGHLADAVVLTEPTGLDLLVAGVGILWLEIAITGKAAHAQSADRAINPIDRSIPVISRFFPLFLKEDRSSPFRKEL